MVTHDGKDKSNKAINHAIYLSKLSDAEITILQIIDDAEQLEGTSVNISNYQELSTYESASSTMPPSSSPEVNKPDYVTNIEGELISLMEKKLKRLSKQDVIIKFHINLRQAT